MGIKIRGHHILCLNFYRGFGYNQEFVKNVSEILRRVQGKKIKIVDGCDDICSACPHMHGGRCEKHEGAEEEVTKMDLDVLVRLGLSPTTRVNFDDVSLLVKKKIKPSDIKEICKDCDWLEICMKESERWA
jgi:hypothetical protein